MSYMMLHGLGDCTPILNCGCLAAQPFEDAPQQPHTTQPTRECPPATNSPQNATQPLTDQQLAVIEARPAGLSLWIDILLNDAPIHGGEVNYRPETTGRGGCGTWAVDVADDIRCLIDDHAALIAEVRRHRAAIAAADNILAGGIGVSVGTRYSLRRALHPEADQ